VADRSLYLLPTDSLRLVDTVGRDTTVSISRQNRLLEQNHVKMTKTFYLNSCTSLLRRNGVADY